MSETFSERARLFCSVGVERLEEELGWSELSSYLAGVLQLFMADPLTICGRWLNEKVVLEGSAFELRVICFRTLVSSSISLYWFLVYQICRISETGWGHRALSRACAVCGDEFIGIFY
jgi:hypothetical protein